MNPPTTQTSTQTPSPSLTPATLAAMQRTTLDALPPRPGASDAEKADQRDGALEFLAALFPRDPVQAMLAAHIVGAHYMAMEYLRRAARHDLPNDLHLRTVGKAVALCRLITRSLDDLARRQGIPMLRPAARPAAQPAAHSQPAPNAAQPTTPSQPSIPEGRHERRRRERAERHLAAAQHRAGPATAALDNPLHQRLRAEVAALVAATAEAVAA
jgi:hypothetical protein